MKTAPQTPRSSPAGKVKLAIASLESKVTPSCANVDYCLAIAPAMGLDPSICIFEGRLAAVADY